MQWRERWTKQRRPWAVVVLAVMYAVVAVVVVVVDLRQTRQTVLPDAGRAAPIAAVERDSAPR